MKGHWSHGLLQSMKDPNAIVISTDKLVAIKDKYPKAQLHFLVLPIKHIPSIFHLNRSHVDLLDEMELLAQNLIEISGRRQEDFKIGYHASPSMQQLHLHVLSTDFDSPYLKTKIHWNSFNTPFFLTTESILEQLKGNGIVQKLPNDLLKNYLAAELTCHICHYKLSNMPKLKEHIKLHL